MRDFTSKFKNIGKTTIKKRENCDLSTGSKYIVSEHLYPTGSDNSLGMDVIPIVDRDGEYGSQAYEIYPVSGEIGGQKVEGCEYLDEAIRKELRISPTSNIFAILSYFHPENGEIFFQEIGDPSTLKPEFSITHTGMYLGEGKTRNSPFHYHGQKLKVDGYPAMATVLTLEGVDNCALTTNLHTVARILNESNSGVDFPDEYKTDTFHLISLESIGSHLRAMLDHSWVNEKVDSNRPFIEIIENCDLFKLYCAEHFWQVVNVALNIPQNERGYVEFYGESIGKELFLNVKKIWREINPQSPEFPQIPYFEPLWKKELVTDPSHEVIVGKGLYCNPQTSTDLVRDIVKMFAPWHEVGPSYSIALIFGFIESISQRLGYSKEEASRYIIKPVILISKYYLKTVDMTLVDYEDSLINDLSKIYGRDVSDLSLLIRAALIDCKDGVIELSTEKAYAEFEEEMESLVVQLRKLNPKQSFDQLVSDYLNGKTVKKQVKYYNPPALIHKIVRGFAASSIFVNFKTIGVVTDYSDTILEREYPHNINMEDDVSNVIKQ